MTLSSKKILLSQPLEAPVLALMKALGLSKTVAKILVNRKITTPEAAQKFLESPLSALHDPYLMKDMLKACQRLYQALQNREKICVYGDYDVDGAVGTALLVSFFKEVGFEVEFYIPCRQKEGYSLNEVALERLKIKGVSLIVTVDNGTMAFEAVKQAQLMKMDVIITDHHEVSHSLPEAFAVLNPKRKDETYPFRELCGAGVAFKLITGLRRYLNDQNYFENRKVPHLKSYLDKLCLSTVCDVVPLVDENRIIVKEGLWQLERSLSPGLKALKDVCGLKDNITATDVGFKLGPRLNAAGRLEDASLGVRLLLTESLTEAKALAQTLDDLNIKRREIEALSCEALIADLSQKPDLALGLVVYDPQGHVGVMGIVASRLVETFKRPVFVLCPDENGLLKGSGRSFGSINLVAALNDCAPWLLKYGGHEAAAGLTLNPEHLENFKKAFDKAIQAQGFEEKTKAAGVWQVDEELTGNDCTLKFWREIQKLAPFGMGHAEPLFCLREAAVFQKRIVGEKHLKLKLKSGEAVLDGICFKRAHQFEALPSHVDAVFHLDLNRYQGMEAVQLMIRDIL